MRIAIVSLAALGLALAACGSSTEQRAATGGLAGAGTGALVGGPVGAVAGAAVGGVGGAALDEGVEKKAERGIEQAKGEDTASGTSSHAATSSGRSADRPSKDEVRRAQQALKSQGLYTAKVDGVMGPKTREALRQFQAREGLQQTAQLDRATQQRLAGGGASTGQGGSATGGGALGAGASSTGTSSTGAGSTPSTGTGTSNSTGAPGGVTGGGGTTR